MKKAYSKPRIIFDSFELSQSIAGACEYITNAQKFVCAITVGDMFVDDGSKVNLFTVSIDACNTVSDDGENSICYDVPYADINCFSS